MGRHLNIETKLAATLGAAFLFVSAGASHPTKADARIPAAQTVPVISIDTPLARDADTFETDKQLDAKCRKTGQEKSVCLCVTHIMKYELTLSEYKAAIRLYGVSGDRSAIRSSLRDEGLAQSDIDMAENTERYLTEDADFAMRCSEAKAYYKTNRD